MHPANLAGEQPKLAADQQPTGRAVRTPSGDMNSAGHSDSDPAVVLPADRDLLDRPDRGRPLAGAI